MSRTAREIRAELNQIAPMPRENSATAEALARHFAVRAQERWTKEMGRIHTPLDHQQLAVMTAEFAAAHVLYALAENGLLPDVAGEVVAAVNDGGEVGEWLWEHLGEETVKRVGSLASELLATYDVAAPAEEVKAGG